MDFLFVNIGGMEFFILLLVLFLWVYSLYHAITNKNLTSNSRLAWVLVIFVGSILGMIIYWVWGSEGEQTGRP